MIYQGNFEYIGNTPPLGTGTIADGAITANKESDDAWSNLASAATTDIGAVNSRNIQVTGVATVTSLGTAAAGRYRRLRFSGSLILTYNAVSLILQGLANITTQANDEVDAVSLGGGNWFLYGYSRASGAPLVPTVSALYSYIAGLLPTSIAGTNTTASLTVTAGQATDSTNVALITLVSTQAWAVSNGNAINGYQGGTTLPNSSTVHYFVCNGASGTGTFASTSLTPTLPTGYTTYFRRIFSLRTSVAGAPLAGTAVEQQGGSYWFYLATHVTDFNSAVTSGAARTSIALTVPDGVKTQPLTKVNSGAVTGSYGAWGSSLDEPDDSTWPYDSLTVNSVSSTGGISPVSITTDVSRQIGIRAGGGGTGTVIVVTRGWIDSRR